MSNDAFKEATAYYVHINELMGFKYMVKIYKNW
jgi:hypothetical protein